MAQLLKKDQDLKLHFQRAVFNLFFVLEAVFFGNHGSNVVFIACGLNFIYTVGVWVMMWLVLIGHRVCTKILDYYTIDVPNEQTTKMLYIYSNTFRSSSSHMPASRL